VNSTHTPQGWGTGTEDRRYPSEDGEHMVVVYRRTQRYGDEEKTLWKNERQKLSKADRLYLAAEQGAER
jgi:hypothetical protein